MLELRAADNRCVSMDVWMGEEQRGWQIGLIPCKSCENFGFPLREI